jgi:cytochrome c biogenesis protein CcmG/thiol:disulfide interchange protein DsbE
MSASGIAAERSPRLDTRLRNLIVLVVTAALIALIAFVVESQGAQITSVELTGDTSGAAPAVGQLPPDFKTTLVDGTAVSLSQFAGQPVWLTFGASWCPDCRTEAPDLEAAYEKYRDQGLVVLAVNIEEGSDAVKAYAGRVGLTYPAVADPSTTIASRYHVMGIPTHYFIGRDGLIKQIRLGGLDPAAMDQLVAGIIQ